MILPPWVSLDPRLPVLLERFGATLCSPEPIFDGTNWLHITSSARVRNLERTRILRVWSAKNSAWQLPGAHGQGDFDLLPVAHREANRAAGCECEVIRQNANDIVVREVEEYWNTPAHLHFEVVWEFEADELAVPTGARWFAKNETQL